MMEERVGPYAILRRLGSGGMAEVFLALDARLDRGVARKDLKPRLRLDCGREVYIDDFHLLHNWDPKLQRCLPEARPPWAEAGKWLMTV